MQVDAASQSRKFPTWRDPQKDSAKKGATEVGGFAAQMRRMDGLGGTGLLRGANVLLGEEAREILCAHALAGVAWRAKGLGDHPFLKSSKASGLIGS